MPHLRPMDKRGRQPSDELYSRLPRTLPRGSVSPHSPPTGLDWFFAAAGSFRIHRARLAGKLAPRPLTRHGVASCRFYGNDKELCLKPDAPRAWRRLWHGACPSLFPSGGRAVEARLIPPERSIRRIGGRNVRDSHDSAPAFPLASPRHFRGRRPDTAKTMNHRARATFVRRSISQDTAEVKVHVERNDASRD